MKRPLKKTLTLISFLHWEHKKKSPKVCEKTSQTLTLISFLYLSSESRVLVVWRLLDEHEKIAQRDHYIGKVCTDRVTGKWCKSHQSERVCENLCFHQKINHLHSNTQIEFCFFQFPISHLHGFKFGFGGPCELLEVSFSSGTCVCVLWCFFWTLLLPLLLVLQFLR